MSFAQQKQRHYAQLAGTLQNLSKELELTNDLMRVTAGQLNAMGKLGALHAAQMMAVQTVEEYAQDHDGQLPGSTSGKQSAQSTSYKTPNSGSTNPTPSSMENAQGEVKDY